MGNINFVNSHFFWLFLLLPVLIFWQWYSYKKETPTVKLSHTKVFQVEASWKVKLRVLLPFFRILSVSALIVALARPQTSSEQVRTKSTDGIDIVLVIDVSTSMLARDLKPNRLEALKSVASQFIKDRKRDRMGIVVYSGESYTKVPITNDQQMLLSGLKEATYGQIEDGTAIGLGLATAVNRLKGSKAKSKIVVLMTDGVNNAGAIDPQTASEIAKNYHIKVYTIGLGTNGYASSPVAYNPDRSFQYEMVKVEIDEKLLQEIAKNTGGKYFRATDNKKLEQIYKEIDSLEKSKIEEIRYYQYSEEFRFWALLALVLLLIEITLRHTVFRGII